jgi:tetratricopeptide (TPR) repeat protein
MKGTRRAFGVLLLLTGLTTSGIELHAGVQEAGGGNVMRDLIGGAALIFRRPDNPKSGPGGGRITGSGTGANARMQDQIIAKGNAARSAAAPRYSDAESQYRLATKQDPKDPRGFAGLGNVFLDQGRFQDAVEAYRQALLLDPDYQLVYMPLGYSLNRLNRHAEAIEVYNQLLKLDPDDPEIYNNLGYSYNHSDKYEESIEACRKAIALLGGTGQAYKQGLQTRGQVLSQAYKNLGNALNGLKRYNEAADALKHSTTIEPSSAAAHFIHGLALYNGGRFSEAIEAYKEVLRIRPGLAQAHYNLGLAYLSINNKALALEEYNALKTLNPELASQLRSAIP